MSEYCKNCYELTEQLEEKEQECEKLQEGYAKLTEIVTPYIDDFTGYNEELGGFDIVLCIKELIGQFDQLKAENEKYKKGKELYEQRLKTREKAKNQFLYERNYAEQKLERIRKICKDYCKIMCGCETKETCESCINTEILQIIDEVE